MILEWYEWECPYCRRIGEVNPTEDYENGQIMHMNCPNCNGEVVVLCEYQPMFVAYHPKYFKERV